MTSAEALGRRRGMVRVLREEPDFRRLWYAQVVSQVGDWLNRVALMVLIARLGGGEHAARVGLLYGVELFLRMMPSAVVGPLAGGLADRVPRRTLMIATDVVRAVVVLGFLFVRDAEQLWLLYVLVTAQMSVAMFFDASRSASTAESVPRADLQSAHALTAATWSVTLAVGSLLGGTLVDALGTDAVFLIDAATYCLSVAFLWRLGVGREPASRDPWRWREALRFADVAEGWRHARASGVHRVVLAKAAWGGAGGYLVLLPLAANALYAGVVGPGDANAILLAARGLGTAAGPLLARRLLPDDEDTLRWQIAAGFLVGAAGYAVFGATTSLAVAVTGVFVAHMGGSCLWVAGSVLWQRAVDDAYRGRVYALEVLGMTLAFSASALVTGLLYDHLGRVDRTTWAVCAVVVAFGALWTWLDRR